MRDLGRAVFGLLFFLLSGCGGDAPSLQTGGAQPPGAPSGIEACDSFVKAACDCAESPSMPAKEAVKEACEVAKQSTDGWRAVADIPDQRAAIQDACQKARATLEGYSCVKKP